MSDKDIAALVQFLQTHTAMGRLSFDELAQALRPAEGASYVIRVPADA